jgi:hypothetical protein
MPVHPASYTLAFASYGPVRSGRRQTRDAEVCRLVALILPTRPCRPVPADPSLPTRPCRPVPADRPCRPSLPTVPADRPCRPVPADPSLPTRPCRPVPAVLKRVMRGDVDACAVLVAPTISALARCGRTVALTCPSRSSTRPDGVDQITRSRMPRMNQSARAGGIESTDRAALKRHIYSPTNSAIWRTRQSTNPPVHQPASPPTRQSTNPPVHQPGRVPASSTPSLDSTARIRLSASAAK